MKDKSLKQRLRGAIENGSTPLVIGGPVTALVFFLWGLFIPGHRILAWTLTAVTAAAIAIASLRLQTSAQTYSKRSLTGVRGVSSTLRATKANSETQIKELQESARILSGKLAAVYTEAKASSELLEQQVGKLEHRLQVGAQLADRNTVAFPRDSRPQTIEEGDERPDLLSGSWKFQRRLDMHSSKLFGSEETVLGGDELLRRKGTKVLLVASEWLIRAVAAVVAAQSSSLRGVGEVAFSESPDLVLISDIDVVDLPYEEARRTLLEAAAAVRTAAPDATLVYIRESGKADPLAAGVAGFFDFVVQDEGCVPNQNWCLKVSGLIDLRAFVAALTGGTSPQINRTYLETLGRVDGASSVFSEVKSTLAKVFTQGKGAAITLDQGAIGSTVAGFLSARGVLSIARLIERLLQSPGRCELLPAGDYTLVVPAADHHSLNLVATEARELFDLFPSTVMLLGDGFEHLEVMPAMRRYARSNVSVVSASSLAYRPEGAWNLLPSQRAVVLEQGSCPTPMELVDLVLIAEGSVLPVALSGPNSSRATAMNRIDAELRLVGESVSCLPSIELEIHAGRRAS